MTGRRGPAARAAAAASAALAALVVAGCGVPAEDTARPLSTDDAPFGLLAGPTATARPQGADAEQLLFVRDSMLVAVTRRAVSVSARSALSDLLSGPSEQERAQGLTTALPPGATRGQVDVTRGVASVDLGPGLLDSGRSDQVLALAQVVVTLDALPGVDAVRFLRDGKALPVPAGDGALQDAPLTAGDYSGLLARS